MKIIALLICMVSVTFSQSFNKPSFPELMKRSDLIVKAKVDNLEAKWVKDSRGKHIYTYTDFQVLDVMKGTYSQNKFRMEIIGGKIGDITETVSTSIKVKKGQEMVLFLASGKMNKGEGVIKKLNVIDNKIFLESRYVPVSKFSSVMKNISLNKIAVPKTMGELQKIINAGDIKKSVISDNKVKKKENDLVVTENYKAVIETKSASLLAGSNLRPYLPAGWSAEIVVSKVTGNHIDGTGFTQADNLYLDWAIVNDGTADISNAFLISLYIDGTLKTSWNANSGLQSGYYLSISDYPLTNISGGNHNIKIVADPANVISESNETDNEFTKAISIQAVSFANLTPYQPSGWSEEIVVSTVEGTNTDASAISEADDLYIDWAVANFGTVDITTPFYINIYVDDFLISRYSLDDGLESYMYSSVTDFSLGRLSRGTHTLKIIADASNAVAESDETDNEFSKTITVSAVANMPSITNITPSSASAGTGSVVVIEGSNFGTTKGTSKVEFFYSDGDPKIESTRYVSWSDTRIECEVPVGEIEDYPASAGSGPVTVTTSTSTSPGYNYNISFGYGLDKWEGSPAVVNYRINENTGDFEGEGSEIISACSSWNSAGANFLFVYDGTTTQTEASYDEINEIMWGTIEESTTLARATYWYEGTTLFECDIVFNDSYTWSKNGSNYDVQTTALHELGHWLNLRDLYGSADYEKTMYGIGYSGEIKRSLSQSDIEGIKWIYGDGSPIAPPSAITNEATAITKTGAVLNGAVNAHGNSTTVSFEYGTTDSYGNTIANTTNPVTGTSYTNVSAVLTGLAENTNYHFRVKAVNTGGTEYGEDLTFKTSVDLPAAPILSAPSLNQLNVPKDYTLVWRKNSQTDKYYVQVSGNSAFSSFILNDSTSADTTMAVTGLSEGDKFFWKVRARNSAGLSSWSDVWNFTTILSKPTNLALERTAIREITLTWSDNTNNESGYVIERKLNTQSNYAIIDSMKSPGNRYVDATIEQGLTYLYRIKAYTVNTESEYSNEANINVLGIEGKNPVPTEYFLFQNYPNPFNPTTKLKFGLPESAMVKLTIHDALGRDVAVLVNEELGSGYHEVTFNAGKLTSGVYFYKISTPKYNAIKKLILLK